MQIFPSIEMFAGHNAQGQPIAERLTVEPLSEGRYRLIKSPAFVKGLARDDLVQFNKISNQFELVQHSGNLCVRIYCRSDTRQMDEQVTPEMEKLGGQLDITTPRMLVYSIHVSCGFDAIEALLDQTMDANSTWLYGNVYDPEDGSTPLNWWLEILSPQ